jgi:hypothetical protein
MNLEMPQNQEEIFTRELGAILVDKKPVVHDSLFDLHQNQIFQNILKKYKLASDDEKAHALREIQNQSFEELKALYFSSQSEEKKQKEFPIAA